ncbi:hypothetical protein PENTCL1PPCAC_27987, partial [Pristionchus entomophagus]
SLIMEESKQHTRPSRHTNLSMEPIPDFPDLDPSSLLTNSFSSSLPRLGATRTKTKNRTRPRSRPTFTLRPCTECLERSRTSPLSRTLSTVPPILPILRISTAMFRPQSPSNTFFSLVV